MKRSAKHAAVTLFIDADIVAYEHASAGQKVYAWDDDDDPSVVTLPLEEMTPTIEERIEALRLTCKATDVVMCLTDSVNFRKAILPTYKAGRRVKPVLLPAIKEWMKGRYRTYQRPGLEGDDVMGILATHPKLIPGDKVIVSIDKDMKQIPGRLYNPGKDEWHRITVEQGDHFHMMQTLTGDPTDEYKGCPGIGPMRAARILNDLEYVMGANSLTLWQAVVRAYTAAGLTEADALVQARVARILRHTDYDFKRKEPILWHPPE